MLITELLKIKENVEKATSTKAKNLASAINRRTLIAIHKKMDGKKAVGVDGVTKEEYNAKLGRNVDKLVLRMKNEAYKPKPSRRVYIDKAGSDKKRPLGIWSTIIKVQ